MLATSWVFGFGVGSSAPRWRGLSGGRNVTGLPGFIALALLTAACAQDLGGSANLPVACETAVCNCASNSGYTAKPPPMQWKIDGTAFCPEGYHLHMPPPPSQRMTVQ